MEEGDTMKRFLCLLVGSLFWVMCSTANAASQHYISVARQTKKSPATVLQALKLGNQRYVKGARVTYDQRALSKIASKKGQAPYAFIFSCVDSRSIPEVVFDQPTGALFVSRIAGNVISPDVLGSMEFATQHAGTKLVVIMGHSQCGAVAGACAGVDKPPNLGQLLAKIQPAVKTVQKQQKVELNCEKMQTIDQIAKKNVLDQLHQLYKDSPATKKLVRSGTIKVVGAMHNIRTGKVVFFDDSEHAL